MPPTLNRHHCSLHIHATIKSGTLHSILKSMLRIPQPCSGRPYVTFEGNNDINAVVLQTGNICHTNGLSTEKCFGIKPIEALSVRIQDADWCHRKALASLCHILTLLTREPLPPHGTPERAEAESRVPTVELHVLDMQEASLPLWLKVVSSRRCFTCSSLIPPFQVVGKMAKYGFDKMAYLSLHVHLDRSTTRLCGTRILEQWFTRTTECVKSILETNSHYRQFFIAPNPFFSYT
jgi:hypothetical protein